MKNSTHFLDEGLIGIDNSCLTNAELLITLQLNGLIYNLTVSNHALLAMQ